MKHHLASFIEKTLRFRGIFTTVSVVRMQDEGTTYLADGCGNHILNIVGPRMLMPMIAEFQQYLITKRIWEGKLKVCL